VELKVEKGGQEEVFGRRYFFLDFPAYGRQGQVGALCMLSKIEAGEQAIEVDQQQLPKAELYLQIP